jgi:hypothetical protein
VKTCHKSESACPDHHIFKHGRWVPTDDDSSSKTKCPKDIESTGISLFSNYGGYESNKYKMTQMKGTAEDLPGWLWHAKNRDANEKLLDVTHHGAVESTGLVDIANMAMGDYWSYNYISWFVPFAIAAVVVLMAICCCRNFANALGLAAVH